VERAPAGARIEVARQGEEEWESVQWLRARGLL
jgi:hypothetical protein